MPMFDKDIFATKLHDKEETRTEDLHTLTVDVVDVLIDLFNNRTQAGRDTINDVKVLLGLSDGEFKTVMRRDSEVSARKADDEPLMIPPTTGPKSHADYWRVYENDGINLATDIDYVHKEDKEKIVRLGLIPAPDEHGNIKGLKKPAATAPPVPPTAPTPPTHKVKVVDKAGSPVTEIELDEYKKVAKEYQVLESDDDGKPLRVRKLPRLVRR